MLVDGPLWWEFMVSFLLFALPFQFKESSLFSYVFLPCDDDDRGFVHKD